MAPIYPSSHLLLSLTLPNQPRWLEDAITEWADSQSHLEHSTEAPGYTRQQVEEVKLVLRLLPIFWTTMVYWWAPGVLGGRGGL
jgi:hypothetical protein